MQGVCCRQWPGGAGDGETLPPPFDLHGYPYASHGWHRGHSKSTLPPDFAKIPIVALSAYEKEDMGNEFFKLGFTHYLNKPFSKSYLMDAIHT